MPGRWVGDWLVSWAGGWFGPAGWVADRLGGLLAGRVAWWANGWRLAVWAGILIAVWVAG